MTDILIQLERLRIFAHHGIHAQERMAGAEFEVDVQVRYSAQGMIGALVQTIDYTRVLQIVRQQMNDPRPLLETVAMDMAETIRQQFIQAKEINITIRKIHPPILNFRGRLAVTLHKTYP